MVGFFAKLFKKGPVKMALQTQVDVATHFIFAIEDLDTGTKEPIGFFLVQTASSDVRDFWNDWIQQPWEHGKNLRLILTGEYNSEDGSFYLYPKHKPICCFYGKPESGKSEEDLL